MIVKLICYLIKIYKYVISPYLRPACRFDPTCSQYVLEAFHQYGLKRGSLLGIKRLLKCHPITWLGGKYGFDPVPEHLPSHTYNNIFSKRIKGNRSD